MALVCGDCLFEITEQAAFRAPKGQVVLVTLNWCLVSNMPSTSIQRDAITGHTLLCHAAALRNPMPMQGSRRW